MDQSPGGASTSDPLLATFTVTTRIGSLRVGSNNKSPNLLDRPHPAISSSPVVGHREVVGLSPSVRAMNYRARPRPRRVDEVRLLIRANGPRVQPRSGPELVTRTSSTTTTTSRRCSPAFSPGGRRNEDLLALGVDGSHVPVVKVHGPVVPTAPCDWSSKAKQRQRFAGSNRIALAIPSAPRDQISVSSRSPRKPSRPRRTGSC